MSSAAVTAAPKKDDATWSDCVAAVHRVEHAAKELPVYADRLALCNELYALIATVATQTEAKAKAALSARHTAASAVDPKFAASAKAQVHSGGSGGSATPFKHEYAPPATAEELKTFRLEVHLGPRCDDPAREVPHSGDKLSSSQFTGQWRRSTLRWGPPTSDGIAAELVSLWPKTPAQVAARLATPHEFPPISNPTGMWLMRDTAGDGQSSSTFYVVDGAYRMAYLADPAHKPKYAVSWPCFTIENEPRFEFFAHNWNAKRLTPTVASPAVPPSHTATPNPTPAATPTAKASVSSADAKVAAK